MIANAKRLARRMAVVIGLAAAGMGVACGIAAAAPAPADDPFIPAFPGAGIGAPGGLGMLSDAAQMMPMLTDAGSMLNAGQDPNAYMGGLQNLLNDGGNMVGVPSAGSYIPQIPVAGTDPNAPDPNAPPLDTGN